MSNDDTDATIVHLVEALTLLLGEDPKFDKMREALFVAAAKSGHLEVQP